MVKKKRKKINKETQALNDTLNKVDLIDICRTFHPKTTEHTFSSHAYGIFSRIYDILGHKTSLGKFKKTEIVSSIFSDHNAMRLDINYRKKSAKNTNRWSLINYLSYHIKKLAEEQIIPTARRKSEMIKIRVGINELESRKSIKKMNENTK